MATGRLSYNWGVPLFTVTVTILHPPLLYKPLHMI